MFQIECIRQAAPVTASTRAAQVAMTFGLSPRVAPRRILHPIVLDLRRGQITALVGPSGSGKSSALEEIEARFPLSHNAQRASLPGDRSVVDCISPCSDLSEALSILAACGLGEAPLWLRRFDELSEGEKFRARLAKVIGLETEPFAAGGGPPSEPNAAQAEQPQEVPRPILCDEFCSGLHRRAAIAVAYNLRKLVTRRGLCVVLAACDETLLGDLQPDVTIRLNHGGGHDASRRRPQPRPISLWRRLMISAGGKPDYHAFAGMHYRDGDELGFVDKVFVLRERGEGEPLGIVVYAHAPMELSLRNQATSGRFSRNPRLLNRELRILRRLVIHPDLRGCGLGRRLVQRTLPMVGVPFVECLASMGQVNPVFERAGMERIGLCPLPPEQCKAIAELTAMDIDPLAPDFLLTACRSPRVREIVAGSVERWYRATSGEGARRVATQSPRFLARLFRGLVGSRPVYYLWRNAECGMRNAE